jgi:hypothetical protein
LGPDTLITVLSGLEVEVEVSALGSGGKEGGVLLGGNIEVLVDLSTFSKFQLQHLLFRRIADAGDTAGIYRNSLHALLDADEPREEQGGRKLRVKQLLDAVDGIVHDPDQSGVMTYCRPATPKTTKFGHAHK